MIFIMHIYQHLQKKSQKAKEAPTTLYNRASLLTSKYTIDNSIACGRPRIAAWSYAPVALREGN